MRKMIPRDMLPELRQLEDGLAQALNLLIEQRTFRGATEEGKKRGLSGGEPGDQMGMESGTEQGMRGCMQSHSQRDQQGWGWGC